MLRAALVRFALSSIAFAVPLLAQQARLDALDRSGVPQPVASVAWFAHHFERVEALLAVDVEAAFEAAKQIVDAAGPGSPPGARNAAIALTAVACSRLEGPAAGAVWLSRAGEPPADTDDRMRAVHHLSRARCLCYLGQHDQELQWAIPGQACAERCGDPVLELRAAFTTLHATQQRGVSNLRKTFDRLGSRPDGGGIAFYRAFLLLEEYAALKEAGEEEKAEAALAEAEREGVATGSVRVQALCAAFRGNALTMRRQLEPAAAEYERAQALYDRLQDLPERIGVRDIHAWLDIQRNQLDAAADRIAEAEALVHDRGFDDLERTLIQTQLELAVRRRDGDAAAALAQELEQRRVAAREHERRIAQYRSSLQAAEDQRDKVTAQLEEAKDAAARRALQSRMELGLLGASALLVLVVHGSRVRRRLRAANADLAEHVRLVEEAREVQARLEERLRETERAECLQTLAAGVAHDFNNLLTSIQGNAELARTGLAGPEGMRHIDNLMESARQAALLCKQLQVYAGGPPPAGQRIDLQATVDALMPVLRAAAPIRVELAPSPTARPTIRIDRAQLEQVLLNLVTNARDANAKNVVVRVGVTESAKGFAGPVALVEVEDDGDGVAPDVAARIFDPFFTTRSPGRGLGLSVVHGTVRRHGGTIELRSEPGRGSAFCLHFPMLATEVRSEPTVVLQPVPRGQPLVLVVDDDDSVRRVLGLMLANLGAEVATFGTGEELLDAVRKTSSSRPVVALVDLDMPGTDGQEVLSSLRVLRPDARRVLLSGHPTSYIEEVIRATVPDLVLSKPLRRDSLRAAITPLLQQKPALGTGSDRTPLAASSGNRDS